MRNRWKPSWAEIELVRRNYADTRTQALADVLGVHYNQIVRLARKLGIKKSEAYLNSEASGRLQGGDSGAGANTRFKKGHQPWHAGKKIGATKSCTSFKKGQQPHNHMPIGAYRIAATGYLEIKFSHEPGSYLKRWKAVHRAVWEEAHGPIPEGMVVAFRDGRTRTTPEEITLDVLELVSKREVMRRNSLHTNYPPEVVELIRLRAVCTRTINTHSRGGLTHEQQHHDAA